MAAVARRAVGDLLHRVGAADKFDDLLFLVVVAVLGAGLFPGRPMRGRGLVVAIVVIMAVMIMAVVIMAVVIVLAVTVVGFAVRPGGNLAFSRFRLTGIGLLRGRRSRRGGFFTRPRFARLAGLLGLAVAGRDFVRLTVRLLACLAGGVMLRSLRRFSGRLTGLGALRLDVFRLFRFGFDRRARHDLGIGGMVGSAAVTWPAHSGPAVRLRLGVAMGALLLIDQRLPVGDRDLVVVGMDFAERQETMAVAAIVDEGGLERRFYPRDLGEVDVAAKLAAAGGLEIEFFDPVATEHDHPGLFRMGRVDEHLVRHFSVS